MNFAADIFRRSADFYRTAASEARDPKLRESLQGLQKEAEKHESLMEQIRRENVTEMILEPIYGLRSEEWQLDPGARGPQVPAELEGRVRGFYLAAAREVSIPEVARRLRRLAEEGARLEQQARELV